MSKFNILDANLALDIVTMQPNQITLPAYPHTNKQTKNCRTNISNLCYILSVRQTIFFSTLFSYHSCLKIIRVFFPEFPTSHYVNPPKCRLCHQKKGEQEKRIWTSVTSANRLVEVICN